MAGINKINKMVLLVVKNGFTDYLFCFYQRRFFIPYFLYLPDRKKLPYNQGQFFSFLYFSEELTETCQIGKIKQSQFKAKRFRQVHLLKIIV